MSDYLKIRYKLKYLWFSGKDGWQVTSFDPRKDDAIGVKEEIGMYVNLEQYELLQQKLDVAVEALTNVYENTGHLNICNQNTIASGMCYAGCEGKRIAQQALDKIAELTKEKWKWIT